MTGPTLAYVWISTRCEIRLYSRSLRVLPVPFPLVLSGIGNSRPLYPHSDPYRPQDPVQIAEKKERKITPLIPPPAANNRLDRLRRHFA